MPKITTLQEELQSFNDVPDTAKDKKDQLIYAWLRNYSERLDERMIESIVRTGVIEGCKL